MNKYLFCFKKSLKRISFLYSLWKQFRKIIQKFKENRKVNSYRKYGYDVLKIVSKIIKQKNLRIVCIEGTLLGLARDGKLISWDDDLDFLVLNKDDFCILFQELSIHHFKRFREIYNEYNELVAVSYKYKGCLVDFAYWDFNSTKGVDYISIQYGLYQIDGLTYINNQMQQYRVWDLEVPCIKELNFVCKSGIDVPFPSNYQEILNCIYGKEWLIPNSNYKPEKKCYSKFYKIKEL